MKKSDFCSELTTYFCDDFASQSSVNWQLLPETENSNTPDGHFQLVTDQQNTVLQYTAKAKGGLIAVIEPDALSKLDTADYYVEAKIRPRMNSTPASKQLYLLGRYQDGNNWYAAALNIQNSLGSTAVEFARMVNGELKRIKKVKTPILQGAQGASDGRWYLLRLQMRGNNLSVFLDGDELVNLTDDSFSARGLIGLWSNNKSFEIDDIRVGGADDLPASLELSPFIKEYVAEVGDEAQLIDVTALTEAGQADTITVHSSAPEVVSLTRTGNLVSLLPVGEGEASIDIRSGSGLTKSISAIISPTFIMPTSTYQFTQPISPRPTALNVYEDTQFSITFDSPVTLGQGSVRIFRASDNQQIDKINLRKEFDNIGVGGNLRKLRTDPIRVDGRTVRITPHANVLKPGTQYYIVITKEAIVGGSLGGKTFTGIGRNGGWLFTTRVEKPAPNKTELWVDDNGQRADYRTVQGALNHAMAHSNTDADIRINIGNGIYEEPLYLAGKNNVTLSGETRDGTIIRYKNNESMNAGTLGRAMFLVKDVDNLTLDNLTFKNTTLIGDGHQAETLYFNSPNGRLVATNTRFISEQDTLNLKGWNWFYNVLVEGNVDFIWGYSKATLFENSEIRTLGDSRGNGRGGYLLQARTQKESDKGFVFLNSKLTRGNGPLGHGVADATTYLARSGGCSGCYDNIVFINTQMDNHIRPIGYLDEPLPLPEVATSSAGWREFNTMDLTGKPRDLSTRLMSMFYSLSASEVAADYCSREQIFADYDNGNGWYPMPELSGDCQLP